MMEFISLIAASILLVANGFDVYTTIKALQRGAVEKNPVVKWMMDKFGDIWFIPKTLPSVTALALSIFYPSNIFNAVVFGGLALFYFYIAYKNHQLERP